MLLIFRSSDQTEHPAFLLVYFFFNDNVTGVGSFDIYNSSKRDCLLSAANAIHKMSMVLSMVRSHAAN